MQINIIRTINMLFDVGFLEHGVWNKCKEHRVVLYSGKEMALKSPAVNWQLLSRVLVSSYSI